MGSVVVLNGKSGSEWCTVGPRPMVFGRDESLLEKILDRCVSKTMPRGNRQVIQKLDEVYHARMEQRIDFTVGYEE